ncbi:putative ankyrin repeat protein RF_0381 [Mytilus trossulus]|uniref:putative ankyrin repeat protein RF_0381 n=1 Tax=Mytilus trossulus TaxID=6551 RepID=UPI00300464D2
MHWRDPLLAAVQYKSVKMVLKLLQFNSVSVEGPCSDFISPLQIAIINDDMHCVRTLIQYKANVNLPDSDGDTALHLAACSETSFAVFKEVLKAGANLYCRDINEKTPLHYACLEANIDKVVAMLKHLNPPVNEPDEEGATPLHFLVDASSEFEGDAVHHVVKTIKLAVKKGFDINTKTKEGETILHVASRGINSELFLPELLKIKGINVTLQNKYREHFIHCFVRYRAGIDTSERFLFYLLDEKLHAIPKEQLTIIMNQQNNDGHLPVSFYIIRGIVNVKLVKHFISFLENINIQEKFGHTLLHLTSQSVLQQNEKIPIL